MHGVDYHQSLTSVAVYQVTAIPLPEGVQHTRLVEVA